MITVFICLFQSLQDFGHQSPIHNAMVVRQGRLAICQSRPMARRSDSRYELKVVTESQLPDRRVWTGKRPETFCPGMCRDIEIAPPDQATKQCWQFLEAATVCEKLPHIAIAELIDHALQFFQRLQFRCGSCLQNNHGSSLKCLCTVRVATLNGC